MVCAHKHIKFLEMSDHTPFLTLVEREEIYYKNNPNDDKKWQMHLIS
jgi:hypothetical protein